VQPLCESMAAPLEIAKVGGAELLRYLEKHGRSEHGAIASQYEKELHAGASTVAAIGAFACGKLVGGLSYGVVPLANDAVSGRLDVVVSDGACRGRGLGSLLVGAFVREMFERFGERTQHFSTVAMHPAVTRCVSTLGFTAADVGRNVPLYQIALDGKRRLALVESADKLVARRLADLRMGCARCKSRRASPWCEGATP
jgi:GNAT superfamily N-acetyltransferase